MTITRLKPKILAKPWGRCDLLPAFNGLATGDRVGEIWFEAPDGSERAPLLIKYLFTSERLSIQVHPDDAQARPQGLVSGKDEAWLVVEAEPDASIGLGPRESLDREKLRTAALDGTIAELIDWRRVTADDFFFCPAGTIHAIGAGLKLIEIQQNVDVTYRLYDYGRARELHIDQAISALCAEPYRATHQAYRCSDGRDILLEGHTIVVERWRGQQRATFDARPKDHLWLIPLAGESRAANVAMRPGDVWLAEGPVSIVLSEDCDLLLAYPGAKVRSQSN